MDDIIVTGSTSSHTALYYQAQLHVALKKLGSLDYSLGIEGKHLLVHANMADCNPISSPMVNTSKFPEFMGMIFLILQYSDL